MPTPTTHLMEVVLAGREDAKLVASLILHQTDGAHVGRAVPLINRPSYGRRPGPVRSGDACGRPGPHLAFHAARRRPCGGFSVLLLVALAALRCPCGGLLVASLRQPLNGALRKTFLLGVPEASRGVVAQEAEVHDLGINRGTRERRGGYQSLSRRWGKP